MTESPGTSLVMFIAALVIVALWNKSKADRGRDMAAGRVAPRSMKDHIAMQQARHFTQMFVRAGYEGGQSLPPNARMMVRVAPEERPRGAFTFATVDGQDIHYSADQVASIRAWSRAGTIFGFGAAGAAAATLTNAMNQHLAGWELEVRFLNGDLLHLYTDSGAPPMTELARLRSRLAGAA